jgi:hypothetical protein
VRRIYLWTVALVLALGPQSVALAYSANKIWYEFLPTGIHRVYVNYTVPELKERREAYVEFTTKKEAERLYWDLVQGADFYPPDPKLRRFVNQPLAPEPW